MLAFVKRQPSIDQARSLVYLDVTAKNACTQPETKTEQQMFVIRPLLNHDDFLGWAISEGFVETVPATMLHVTVGKIDSVAICQQISPCTKDLTVHSDSRRFVRDFGGIMVLTFGCQKLSRRHAEFRRLGMRWNYPSYVPHISFALDADIGLAAVRPFHDRLCFGPERFSSPTDLFQTA